MFLMLFNNAKMADALTITVLIFLHNIKAWDLVRLTASFLATGGFKF